MFKSFLSIVYQQVITVFIRFLTILSPLLYNKKHPSLLYKYRIRFLAKYVGSNLKKVHTISKWTNAGARRCVLGNTTKICVQVSLETTPRISIVVWFVAYSFGQVNHYEGSRQDLHQFLVWGWCIW